MGVVAKNKINQTQVLHFEMQYATLLSIFRVGTWRNVFSLLQLSVFQKKIWEMWFKIHQFIASGTQRYST